MGHEVQGSATFPADMPISSPPITKYLPPTGHLGFAGRIWRVAYTTTSLMARAHCVWVAYQYGWAFALGTKSPPAPLWKRGVQDASLTLRAVFAGAQPTEGCPPTSGRWERHLGRGRPAVERNRRQPAGHVTKLLPADRLTCRKVDGMPKSVVLVVEDNAAIRKGVADALRLSGYEVQECGHGDEAAVMVGIIMLTALGTEDNRARGLHPAKGFICEGC